MRSDRQLILGVYWRKGDGLHGFLLSLISIKVQVLVVLLAWPIVRRLSHGRRWAMIRKAPTTLAVRWIEASNRMGCYLWEWQDVCKETSNAT